MASFDYARPRATADRLIAKFGQAGAIRRTTAGGGDPWSPTPGTTTDHACTLVVTEYSVREREGTLIQARDKKVLVATEGLNIEPTEADQIVVQGQAMEIIDVAPLAPGGDVVMYTIQARG